MDNAVIEKEVEVHVSEDVVRSNIERILEQFCDLLEINTFLEIDSVTSKDGEEGLKIVHHGSQDAFFVPINQILSYPPGIIVNALETGIFINLEGVTRIVGYYSRVSNWNKSKIGELRDRRVGNYDIEKQGSKLRNPEKIDMV